MTKAKYTVRYIDNEVYAKNPLMAAFASLKLLQEDWNGVWEVTNQETGEITTVNLDEYDCSGREPLEYQEGNYD